MNDGRLSNGTVFSFWWFPCTLWGTRRTFPGGFTAKGTIDFFWAWVAMPNSTNLLSWHSTNVRYANEVGQPAKQTCKLQSWVCCAYDDISFFLVWIKVGKYKIREQYQKQCWQQKLAHSLLFGKFYVGHTKKQIPSDKMCLKLAFFQLLLYLIFNAIGDVCAIPHFCIFKCFRNKNLTF